MDRPRTDRLIEPIKSLGESCSGAGVCQCDESDPDATAKCVCDENFSGDYCETYTLPVEIGSAEKINSSGDGVPAIEGGTLRHFKELKNFDGDGVPDYIDPDDDNDGIPDYDDQDLDTKRSWNQGNTVTNTQGDLMMSF